MTAIDETGLHAVGRQLHVNLLLRMLDHVASSSLCRRESFVTDHTITSIGSVASCKVSTMA